MKLNQNQKIALLIGIIVLGAVIVYNKDNLQFPMGATGGNNAGNGGSTGTQQGTGGTTVILPTNEKAPTSLTASVSPNPARVTGAVVGQVISDGYNYPITIHIKHLTSGQESSISGLLGSNGQFQSIQQINSAGYWEFWVTAGSVSSNKVALTVEGINVELSSDFWSRTFAPPFSVVVYTNYKNSYCTVIYNHPASSTSGALGTVRTDSNGYAKLDVDWSGFVLGDYEIDAVIGPHKASDDGLTRWVRLGR